MEKIEKLNKRIQEYINVPVYIKMKYLIILVTSYLIGTINFYNSFSVFSIALYTAGIKNKASNFLLTAILLLACLKTGEWDILTKFILIIFFTFLITYKEKEKFSISKMSIYKISLLYSLLYYVLSITLLYLHDNLTTYTLFLELLASLLILSISVMINKTYNFLYNKHKKNIIEKDTIISLIVYFLLVLVSLRGVYISGVYVQEFIILLILEISTYVMGELYGGLVGTLITVPIILSGGYEISMSILSFIGIIMGILKNINKYIFSLIYICISYVLYLTYADSVNLSITFMTNLLITQFIFLLIPSKVYVEMRQKFEDMSKIKKKVYYEKVKQKICTNMKNESQKLKNFAMTLEDLLHIDENKEKNEIIIDNTIKKVCSNCQNQNECWKNNFYTTYTKIMDIFRLVNENIYNNSTTAISIVNTAINNKRKCMKYDEIIKELSKEYKKQLEKNKDIDKSKNIKNAFMKFSYEMSSILNNMILDINEYKVFRTHLEEDIYYSLIEKDISILRININQQESNRYEVEISLSIDENTKKTMNNEECTNILIIIENKLLYEVSKKLKRKFKIASKNISIEDEITFILTEKENINLEYGIFQTSKFKEDDNGDKYTILKISDEKILFAISDGMGKGKVASEKSKTALKLLESLTSLNIEEKFMIELINIFLINNQDVFATLDICLIDIYNATGKFLKSGSVSSYVKRRKKDLIEKIESKSLPVGIVFESQVDINNTSFNKGDILIMISDGVIDNINSDYEKENYLIDMINQIEYTTAQEFSFNLGSQIAKKNVLKDDMTILTVKIN